MAEPVTEATIASSDADEPTVNRGRVEATVGDGNSPAGKVAVVGIPADS
jgi:hypothetical protein